jgi:hypothetical protein
LRNFGRELLMAEWAKERIHKPFLTTQTVFDVGVGHGTPGLYRAFPDLHHVLIEPLADIYSDSINTILNTYDAEIIHAALGSVMGEAEIFVPGTAYQRSSRRSRSHRNPLKKQVAFSQLSAH